MAKRRTRAQKQKTQHQFLKDLYLNPQAKIGLVKGEFKRELKRVTPEARKQKKSDNSPQESNEKFIKRDVVKSLLLASLILSLEVVLYLAWK
ncbi:hypothetical protein HYT59_00445 [Candidatus Woesebacteria bacterium]|nr:hypothetical protein [Candidatus Woesebacteria bacterium]